MPFTHLKDEPDQETMLEFEASSFRLSTTLEILRSSIRRVFAGGWTKGHIFATVV
jgi:hypothetical protein